MRSVILRAFLFCLLILSTYLVVSRETPKPTGKLVSDFIGLLNTQEVQALESKLLAYNDSTSTQIAIVIENSLDGEDIFDYSFRLARDWGIGQSDKDNGILIYVAFSDRKVFIQTGSGVEGFLPDAMAKRIIENIIVPGFRQQMYYKAFDDATSAIISLGSGEFNALGISQKKSEPGPILFMAFIIFFIIVLVIIVAVIRCIKRGDCVENTGGGYNDRGKYRTTGKRTWGSGGFGVGGFGGFGGSSGGFGSGGGFGGFGGGGFSGGGAGGGW